MVSQFEYFSPVSLRTSCVICLSRSSTGPGSPSIGGARVEAGYHLATLFETPHDVVVASVGPVVAFHFVHLSHVCHYTPLPSISRWL